MAPENSAQPEFDIALDAIVYEVHPALVPDPSYPYAARPAPSQTRPAHIAPSAPTHEHVSQNSLAYTPPPTPQYVVPQRFGMSAIIGITTALALLFGGLRILDADPVVYLFFGLQGIVICIVQMFSGKAPRLASAIAGAVMAPLFATRLWQATDPLHSHINVVGAFCLMVTGVPIGAFLGYLTGTCAAGVFLVIDAMEAYLREEPVSASTSSTVH
jgi:hypothetical protein